MGPMTDESDIGRLRPTLESATGSATDESDAGRLQQALASGHDAFPELVSRWTPIIQARVVRVLRRRATGVGDRALQEVEELVQQVFVKLFENQAAALRAWQPERGLSLDNWVGLIAEQQVLALLRTRKRNPWTEEPTLTEELDRISPEPSPEHAVLSRNALDHLLDRMQERLSPLGWRLFCLLYLQEEDVDTAARSSGLTTTAVYGWRSRLRRLALELRDVLLSESEALSHKTKHGPKTEVTT